MVHINFRKWIPKDGQWSGYWILNKKGLKRRWKAFHRFELWIGADRDMNWDEFKQVVDYMQTKGITFEEALEILTPIVLNVKRRNISSEWRIG